MVMRARSAERKGRAGGSSSACSIMLVVARANALRSARQMHTLQTTFICVVRAD